MVAGALTAALLLAGCSGDGTPSGLKTFTGASSAATSSPSTTASASPTSVDNGLPKTYTLKRGKVPSGLTADQKAAVEAWMAYWEWLGKADQVPAFDVTTVGSVMRGQARQKAAEYVGFLQQHQRRLVGSATVDVTSIKVSGSTATLCSHMMDGSFEVDRHGVPQEDTEPNLLIFKGGLTRSGPTWLVTSNVTGRNVCR